MGCTLPRAPAVKALSEGSEGQQQGSFSGSLAAQTKLRTGAPGSKGPWLGFASPHSQRLTPWVPRKCVRVGRTERLHFHVHFHALEKEMATHSSVLAWRIPGTAELGGLPSMGSHRVRHDLSDLAVAVAVAIKDLEKVMATQYSCLENPMEGGAW